MREWFFKWEKLSIFTAMDADKNKYLFQTIDQLYEAAAEIRSRYELYKTIHKPLRRMPEEDKELLLALHLSFGNIVSEWTERYSSKYGFPSVPVSVEYKGKSDYALGCFFIAERRIWINPKLLFCYCREDLLITILHELCHLRIARHSAEFYRLLNGILEKEGLPTEVSHSPSKLFYPLGRILIPPSERKGTDGRRNIGDYVEISGRKGVVFEVDREGLHGKIVSLAWKWTTRISKAEREAVSTMMDDADGLRNHRLIMALPDWKKNFPSFHYASSLGKGWYLPARKEVESFLGNESVLKSLYDHDRRARQESFDVFVQEHISENYLSSTDFNEAVIWKGPDLPWKYRRSVATF